MKNIFYSIFISTFFISYPLFASTIPKKIEYEIIQVKNLQDLKTIKNKNFVYSLNGLKLSALPINEKKKTFINLLLPSINIVNKIINRDKQIIDILSKKTNLSENEQLIYNKIFQKYLVKNNNVKVLKERMIIYPTPLILAQGALESGWGTSQIFQKANNLFGMHSFNPDEPRIPSRSKNVFLKKYKSIEGSVYDFVLTLSRSGHYKQLRQAVREKESPQKIAEYLNAYSEIKEQYTIEINKVISSNNLMKYYN